MSTAQSILHLSETRGRADFGWLKSRHTFSFADYYNPSRMNFGALRVLNDDRILGGTGFGTHPHQNMEIISIPISGGLQHEDSFGHNQVIQQGEVQVMSAGTGIAHSEFNASPTEEAQFLQIWILPKKLNIQPRYDQKKFDLIERKNKFQLVVSNDGRDGSLKINQDAFLSLVDIEEGTSLTYSKKMAQNGVYFFLIDGEADVGGENLRPRDAVGFKNTDHIEAKALQPSQLLVIEVPLT